MKNHIVHVDLDAFYASVEELDHPEWKGKPLVVGGKSEHGIVTTANYEARKYGIHSAMPMFQAKALCENLIICPMHRSRYLGKSQEVVEVLKTYTKLVEKVSIDEAYLDISHFNGDLYNFAHHLQDSILEKTGLSLSIGISYNKFLAKLASDWNKPSGIKIISEEDMPDILLPLSIRKVHGIGKQSERKLQNLGIYTVEDLYELSLEFLISLFGKGGEELYFRIRGVDNRVVKVERERKSLGTERTFTPTKDEALFLQYLKQFSEELANDLVKKGFGAKTLTIKVKNSEFQIHTRSKTYDTVQCEQHEIFENAKGIFEECYDGSRLRLIGLTASNLVDLNQKQLSFFEE